MEFKLLVIVALYKFPKYCDLCIVIILTIEGLKVILGFIIKFDY